MKYISEFEIKNFRGFDYLKLSDLGKINILFGKNNCGKSSILEGIFLLTIMNDISFISKINLLRSEGNKYKYLFHNVKIDETITFKAVCNEYDSRVLKITNNKIMEDDVLTTSDNSDVKDLNINYLKTYKSLDEKKVFTHTTNAINFKNNDYFKEEYRAILINSNTSNDFLIRRYNDLVKRKKNYLVLNVLKEIEEKLNNIYSLPDGIYCDLINLKELLPIALMGDGFQQYLKFITLFIDYNIILIDEIENGLHFSIYKSLWQSIINLSKEFNSQLFITTHSLETLKTLKEVLEDEKNKNMRTEVKAINIVHTKKAGIKAYNYDFESLREMIDTETEIR